MLINIISLFIPDASLFFYFLPKKVNFTNFMNLYFKLLKFYKEILTERKHDINENYKKNKLKTLVKPEMNIL